MTIAIAGANGQTGRAVLNQLRLKGIRPVALTTNERSATLLRQWGAEPVIADMRRPQSLRDAFQGVERVLHIPPRMQPDEYQLGLNVIEACIASKVRHLVVHSVITPHLEEIVFHWAKMKLEAALFHEGLRLPYTILRPTNYMQNAEWFWPDIHGKGVFCFPYSADKGLTWVDVEDVGESIANVLTEDDHEFATYELCGRESFLNRHELAAIWSEALGRPVRAETMDIESYMALPRWSSRKPDEMARLRTMFRHYDECGLPSGNHRVLSMLLRRPATTYAEYARRVAAREIATPSGSAPGG